MPDASRRRQTVCRDWPQVIGLFAFGLSGPYPPFGWGPVRGIRATEGVCCLAISPCPPRLEPLAPLCRPLAFAAGFAASLAATSLPAMAQDGGISILRDTETEEMLQSYEAPLARAAGLDPVAPGLAGGRCGDQCLRLLRRWRREHFHLRAASSCRLKTPNELIGVMAHETGHIKAGHLSRGEVGMKKAMIPMLLSMVAGVGGDDRGRGPSRHGADGRGPGGGAGAVRTPSPASRNPPPTRSPCIAAGDASVAAGHL